MSAINRITAQFGRPLLMTEDAARYWAERVRGLDAKAFERPRSGLLNSPARFVEKLRARNPKAGKPAAMDDADAGESAPAKPSCYAPLYARTPTAEGFGWCLTEGIATMAIEGPIADRGFEFCGAYFPGYDTIAHTMREAMADPDVRGLFVRVNSPGGVVAGGISDLAAQMRNDRAANGGKPIWVYADMACSASYWIAAQADRIIAPKVGMVGSIGVVLVHEDISGALDKMGVQITTIEFPRGGLKTDGAYWKALSEESIARLQAEIDQCGQLFLADVVAGRPTLTEQRQIDLRAGVYLGINNVDKNLSGVALGLVDEIAGEEAAFRALQKHVSGDLSISPAKGRAPAARGVHRAGAHKPKGPKEANMASVKVLAASILAFTAAAQKKALNDTEIVDGVQELLDQRDAPVDGDEPDEPAEGAEETSAEGDEEAAPGDDEEEDKDKTPAARAIAVTTSPEARGREKAAGKLAAKAAEGKMTVKEARALLADMPKVGRLQAAVPDPKLGRGGNSERASAAARHAAALDPNAIYAARAAVGGAKR